MKALQFTEFGQADAVCLVEESEPRPGPGEVVVSLEAAALNPSEFMILDGVYAIRPTLPSAIGSEGVGRLSALGEGVDSMSIGSRVIVVPSGNRGTWREKLVVRADQVVPIQDGGDAVQLSMVGINALTALLLLRHGVETRAPGSWIAQTAANSGLGAYVRALATRGELRVIDVVRRQDAAEELRSAGAQAVLVAGPELADQTRQILEGEQLRLILDGVGGDAVSQLTSWLGPEGHLVSYAALGSEPVVVHPMYLTFGNLHVHGLWLERWLQDAPAAEIVDGYQEVARLVGDGSLHAPVAATFTLDEYESALAQAREFGRDGKVVFTF